MHWVRIPPYAHTQSRSWSNCLNQRCLKVVDNTRRMSSLIELQTFFSDAVRVVNDRYGAPFGKKLFNLQHMFFEHT